MVESSNIAGFGCDAGADCLPSVDWYSSIIEDCIGFVYPGIVGIFLLSI